MDGGERRISRRVVFFAEAQLEGIDAGREPVRVADLSVDGAFVDARTVLPAGAVARMRFSVLGQDVETKVEIRYSMPGMGMGVRFLDLAPAAREAIERLVASQ